MNRSRHSRVASDVVQRPATPQEGGYQTMTNHGYAYSRPNSSQGHSSKAVVIGRRHASRGSLPHDSFMETMYSRPLTPYEERYLGRTTNSPGIALAESLPPVPSVTGKLISSMKRAVSIKKDKSPNSDMISIPQQEEDLTSFAHHVTRSPTPNMLSDRGGSDLRRSRTNPHSIITAHRSPFGGYTKNGEFVVTRTTSGERLPVPQPHPHSHSHPHVNLPPPPTHSALRKTSTISSESADSSSVVTPPDSASSTGSTNGSGGSGLWRNKSMFARLVGKSHRRNSSVGSAGDTSEHGSGTSTPAVKKAVRFSDIGEKKPE